MRMCCFSVVYDLYFMAICPDSEIIFDRIAVDAAGSGISDQFIVLFLICCFHVDPAAVDLILRDGLVLILVDQRIIDRLTFELLHIQNDPLISFQHIVRP